MATLDDFGILALAKYTDTLKDYNSKVIALKSVSSLEDFTKSFMDSAPELADINADIEKLESALESLLGKRLALATPLVQPAYDAAVSGSGIDLTALEEQLKLLKSTAKFLTTAYGEDAIEGTDKIESRAKAGGASGTSGGRRIRGFDVYIDGTLAAAKNAKGEMKSTFSVAAKILEVETTELQRAFFEAAKSEDYTADDFPATVKFDFKDHNVEAMKVDDSSDSE